MTDNKLEKIARILFDENNAVPAEWDWAVIKAHAPMSAIRYESLAAQLLPLLEEVKREERERVMGYVEKTFSDNITKGEMTATNAWQVLQQGGGR